MSVLKIDKVVSALPGTLVANTIYAVRVGVGFDLYISDSTGAVAHKINGGGGDDRHWIFRKADPGAVAFTKTAAGAVSIKAGISVSVGANLVEFASTTAVSMPTLTAGVDYAIWLKDDATIQATSDHVSAPGVGNWRKIGGFHYAPGGNAPARAGGGTTPQINEYSLWDLNFRPACPDPRGMTLVADSFWADIYLLGVNHHTEGTSKLGATIAAGATPPKIPAKFGGDGTAVYPGFDWWTAAEVLQSHGKRPPSYSEFGALAFGTTEANSNGSDPITTSLISKYTSKWGCIQSTGVVWVWGSNFGGGQTSTGGFGAITGGRGSCHTVENPMIFGGSYANTASSGSRAMAGILSINTTGAGYGARGVSARLFSN